MKSNEFIKWEKTGKNDERFKDHLSAIKLVKRVIKEYKIKRNI